MSAERAYRAALRWYPARWRRDNGDVLVGTLMDAADAEGRTAPAVLVFSVPWLVLRTFDALWMSMPGGRSLAPLALVVIPVLVIVIIAVSRRRRAPAPPVR